ncbi:AAA family ATPase, partial [uncultured Sulfitobacter sp.]|uniref:AAA family ATPase n=1 Tax=uncultured Sulfitobacter sp. TaxID=191468 RepID=UPI002599077F
MLRGLDISDMLIIDRLELAFQPGLNVLTGETGAGKSILLDSLGFVLGWRGRADLVEEKLRALDRLAEADMHAVLVAAIERGVNEHEVGAIVEFGLRHPAVFGVN